MLIQNRIKEINSNRKKLIIIDNFMIKES